MSKLTKLLDKRWGWLGASTYRQMIASGDYPVESVSVPRMELDRLKLNRMGYANRSAHNLKLSEIRLEYRLIIERDYKLGDKFVRIPKMVYDYAKETAQCQN